MMIFGAIFFFLEVVSKKGFVAIFINFFVIMEEIMIRQLIKVMSALTILIFGASIVFAQTIKLRLMETADIHVHLMNYDYYQDKSDDTVGLARTATLIEQARQENPNNMLFDNGDLIPIRT